jgi:pantothenate kinase
VILGTIDEVVQVVTNAASGRTRTLVGIAGSPGSGKSTLATEIVARLQREWGREWGLIQENSPAQPAVPRNPAASGAQFPESPELATGGTANGGAAALLPMDGFHLPQSRLRELGRRERMGAPDTFDVDAFTAVLRALHAGGHVLAPGFDRAVEEPVPDAIAIPGGARIVVVEGNYLLLDTGGWEAVRPLLDLSLFVQLEHGIRLQRLIERHERFGKSAADARAWASGPDEANARLIEPTAANAMHRIRLPGPFDGPARTPSAR